MLQDALNTAECLDHVGPVVVQVPEFTIMTLVGPPEGILFQYLELLKVLADSPALVVGESQSILLEQGVNSWDTVVPTVLEVIER